MANYRHRQRLGLHHQRHHRRVDRRGRGRGVGTNPVAITTTGTIRRLTIGAERVALLMEDYAYFVQNHDPFCERLDALTELRGKKVVEGWKAQVRSGQIEPIVQALLTEHYDPVYVQSMKRNFKQYANAQTLAPSGRSAQAMLALAKELAAKAV